MDILKKINLIKADGTKKPASEVFAGKEFICIYFSGHWCPPCRGFTPILKDFYEVCAHTLIMIYNGHLMTATSGPLDFFKMV